MCHIVFPCSSSEEQVGELGRQLQELKDSLSQLQMERTELHTKVGREEGRGGEEGEGGRGGEVREGGGGGGRWKG